MLEFVLGAMGVAAFMRFRRHRGFGGHGRWGGRGFRQRFLLNRLSERLDATPGQEKVMREVMEQFEQVAESLRGEWEKTRTAASNATKGETFNAAELREAWTRHDVLVGQLREAAVDGLRKVHEALEPEQRRMLADLLEHGVRGGHGHHGWGGPFRHHGPFGGRGGHGGFGRHGRFGGRYDDSYMA